MNIVIGQVALIQRSKKQDFVLKVIHALKLEGHNVFGLFPGECRDQDFMTELTALTQEFGLEDDVIFLGRRNDIPDLLKLIDVLIIPSEEGFPLAGLEAAAAGVPVAACDVAGAREFIEVSKGGTLFAEDSVDSCIRAVEQCLLHRQQIQADGERFAESCGLVKYRDAVRQIFAL